MVGVVFLHDDGTGVVGNGVELWGVVGVAFEDPRPPKSRFPV